MRVIYGINPVMEALKSGRDTLEKVFVARGRADRTVQAIIDTARARGVSIERRSPGELEGLSQTPRHQGVVAIIAGQFRYSDIHDAIEAWKASGQHAFFLILDSVQDPQNLGSLIRTAHAAGVHGVIIPKDRAAEVTPAVVKASAGATEHTLIAREVNISRAIETLKEQGVWVAAIEAGCEEELYSTDLSHDIAVVIGSEGHGIRRLVRESCDYCLSIPMAGKVNSLNAAQAGAVAMFEIRRQRLNKTSLQ